MLTDALIRYPGLSRLHLFAAEVSISQRSSGYARTARWLGSRQFTKLDLHDHFVFFISVPREHHKIRQKDRSSWEIIKSCVLVSAFLVRFCGTANAGISSTV